MTAIVGLKHKNTVYIGGDSAGVSGYSVSVRTDEKVFHNDKFIMGFTTSFRMGQLLRYSFKPPKQKKNQNDFEYMSCDFVDAIRKCFTDKGYLIKQNSQESGGSFMVGYNKQLYTIHDDFQVGQTIDEYGSVGSGCFVALGSLYSTAGQNPEERIMLALSAAEYFNAGVRKPFKIVKC